MTLGYQGPPRGPQRVSQFDTGRALYDAAASRAHEATCLASHAPQVLMQRAGLAVAKLALAVAPHARQVWVAAGPGNNGGDGMLAALALQRAGVKVWVSLTSAARRLSGDAPWAHAQALAAGVPMGETPCPFEPDLALDALLGLGTRRAPEGRLLDSIVALNACPLVLAIDLPSGLHPDTGAVLGEVAVRADHTLSLLTLKPGLFTALGRDHAGQVWLDELGAGATAPATLLRLCGRQDAAATLPTRRHASHKGSYGDVAVVGGAAGMTGAALLAAQAALGAGAGRVFVSLLDSAHAGGLMNQPELMLRPTWWRSAPSVLAPTTVVCGCGGGDTVAASLPALLSHVRRLVLDADALNAVAADPALQALLKARQGRGLATVLTPHPLEAARLLACSVVQVQADRVAAATALAQQLGCITLLKGSGTVIAAPGGQQRINPSGNALLASGGTGDVLAGWLGGLWAQQPADVDEASAVTTALTTTSAAAWWHGLAADEALARQPGALPLRAADLAQALPAVASRHR